jgi:hypothetical protein
MIAWPIGMPDKAARSQGFRAWPSVMSRTLSLFRNCRRPGITVAERRLSSGTKAVDALSGYQPRIEVLPGRARKDVAED